MYFSEEEVLEAVFNSIRKSLREDAISFLKLSLEDVAIMEHMLYALAPSPPGEFSAYSLSKDLGVSKYKVYSLLNALSSMQILRVIPAYGSFKRRVRAMPKVLFYHPTLRASVCRALSEKVNEGSMREDLAAFFFSSRGYRLYSLNVKAPDYVVVGHKERYVVEIGGFSKSKRQFGSLDVKGEKVVLTPKQLMTLGFY